VGGQEPGDLLLVLLGGERARGVDEDPARSDQAGGAGEQPALAVGAAADVAGAPLGGGGRVAAEQPLARAGGVQQDPVEHRREPVGQPGHGVGGDGRPPRAPAVQVVGQRLDPGALELVGHHHPGGAEPAGDQRGLASGGGGQVEDPLARPDVQGLAHRHGRRLLDIAQPGGVGDGVAGPGPLGQEEALPAPRHRVGVDPEQAGQLGRVELERVGPHGPLRRPPQGIEQGRRLVPEQLAHAGLERARQAGLRHRLSRCSGARRRRR
jgi:hypothetical protein